MPKSPSLKEIPTTCFSATGHPPVFQMYFGYILCVGNGGMPALTEWNRSQSHPPLQGGTLRVAAPVRDPVGSSQCRSVRRANSQAEARVLCLFVYAFVCVCVRAGELRFFHLFGCLTGRKEIKCTNYPPEDEGYCVTFLWEARV